MFKAIFAALLVPFFTFTLSGTAISSDFDIEYACENASVCHFSDEETGLYFTLSNGWAAEKPFFYTTAGGARDEFPTQVYVSRPDGPNPFVAVLNPRQWVGMNGPCAETWRGQLCHFESMVERNLDGFQILWTSLNAKPLSDKALSKADIDDILAKLADK